MSAAGSVAAGDGEEKRKDEGIATGDAAATGGGETKDDIRPATAVVAGGASSGGGAAADCRRSDLIRYIVCHGILHKIATLFRHVLSDVLAPGGPGGGAPRSPFSSAIPDRAPERDTRLLDQLYQIMSFLHALCSGLAADGLPGGGLDGNLDAGGGATQTAAAVGAASNGVPVAVPPSPVLGPQVTPGGGAPVALALDRGESTASTSSVASMGGGGSGGDRRLPLLVEQGLRDTCLDATISLLVSLLGPQRRDRRDALEVGKATSSHSHGVICFACRALQMINILARILPLALFQETMSSPSVQRGFLHVLDTILKIQRTSSSSSSSSFSSASTDGGLHASLPEGVRSMTYAERAEWAWDLVSVDGLGALARTSGGGEGFKHATEGGREGGIISEYDMFYPGLQCECIVLMGYFTLENAANQETMHWGMQPTLVLQLTTLPFEYVAGCCRVEVCVCVCGG